MPIDNSYKELQRCGLSSAAINTLIETGLWKTGEVCPDDILWYEDGKDIIVTDLSGEIAVSREENEGSTTSYVQTTSGKVTWSRSITIKPTFNSRFYQKLLEIQTRNSQEGYDGQLFQIYSDGGFHMRITHETKDKSLKIQEVALNMKVETFPDYMATNFNDTEAEFEMPLLIEYDPIYIYEGTLPSTFALPSDVIAPSIVQDSVINDLSSITIQATLNDPDGVTSPDKFEKLPVTVTDSNGVTVLVTELDSGVSTNLPVVLTPGETYNIQYGYYLTENSFYNILVTEYTAV